MTAAAAPRVALVSIGIGRIQRGFERYFSDLFESVRGLVDITLFRGEGPSPEGQRVPRMLGPTSLAIRVVPWRKLDESAEIPGYKRDCAAYAVAMLPDLLRDRWDVVHFIDPPLAAVLSRLRGALPVRPRLLFTEGSVMPPKRYPAVDHIHHVALGPYENAIRHGIPAAHMSMIPCGIHAERFRTTETREALRSRYGVPSDAFLVLVVSAQKREHKRVDHVIDEVSGLPRNAMLWIDGNPQDPEIPRLAAEKLGARCRVTHLPSDRVKELYAMADVLVHGALSESFGLVLVEALAAGLPVLAHDDPHFAWLLGRDEYLVDMAHSGPLRQRLLGMMSGAGEWRNGAEDRAREIRERIDWSVLAPEYAEMYRRVAATPARKGRR